MSYISPEKTIHKFLHKLFSDSWEQCIEKERYWQDLMVKDFERTKQDLDN